MLKNIEQLLQKWFIILSCLVIMAASNAFDKKLEPPSLPPVRPPSAIVVVRDLPLPANLHGRKHLPLHGGPIPTLSPAHPPSYGPFISTGQAPASSHLSKPFEKRTQLGPQIPGFKDISPMHSATGSIPSGLSQPPLSPYVSSKSFFFLCVA